MVAVIPWTVTLLVPLGIIFFVLQQYFLETSGDVKRLECAGEFPGALRLGWQLRLASIYAVMDQTPEILQTLLTLGNWILWPL